MRICAPGKVQMERSTNKSQSNHKVSRSDLEECSRKRHLQQRKVQKNSQHVVLGSPGISHGGGSMGCPL